MTAGSLRVAAEASLPLMGIRISPAACGSRCTRSGPHYPSWGSGSASRTAPTPSTHGSHYPSWGSGSCSRSDARYWISSSSLPLMGIRIKAGAVIISGDPVHSLPLMGIRISASFTGDDTSPSETSLPLMGIRISLSFAAVSAVRLAASLPLMGIRIQLAGRVHQRLHVYPHYPSWGSGSTRLSSSSPITRDSLPLMGIRISPFQKI